jgi:hypothetical protein
MNIETYKKSNNQEIDRCSEKYSKKKIDTILSGDAIVARTIEGKT